MVENRISTDGRNRAGEGELKIIFLSDRPAGKLFDVLLKMRFVDRLGEPNNHEQPQRVRARICSVADRGRN
jgi:hypothetical protein